MCPSQNVHLSNYSMECGTGVALHKGVKCFQGGVDGKEIYAKKCKSFIFFWSQRTHRHVGALKSRMKCNT